MKRTKNNILTSFISLLLVTATAFPLMAHHSTRGIYHEDQTIELTGTVKEWVFTNPHPYLTITVENENGETIDWDASFGGSAVVHLRRRGYSNDTFAIGETITVHGNPARKEGVYGILMEGGSNEPLRADGTPAVEGGSQF